MRTEDELIACALIHQVTKAAKGHSEMDVRTVITRPMWEAWCRFAQIPENSIPTDWIGIKDTHRVFGSETVIVNWPHLASVSFLR